MRYDIDKFTAILREQTCFTMFPFLFLREGRLLGRNACKRGSGLALESRNLFAD